MSEISEPIEVWAFFQNFKFQPAVFFWKGRRIKVSKINLVHTSKTGSTLFYHFSVSSEDNFYHLKFDSSKLRWFLENVELDS